jgi:hypothetical protein
MTLDRREIILGLGGGAAVNAMSPEARADALEEYLSQQLDSAALAKLGAPAKPLTTAELDDQIESRNFRRGVGTLFATGASTPFGNRVPGEDPNVRRLPPLPAKPTLQDFFRLRFAPATHVLQSATKAMRSGMSEELILACLLHDVAQALMKTDHGWWGAQLFEPYVPEKVTFAIRYHQALRFYPDPSSGYEYPGMYNLIFGKDYVPPPHVEAAYKFCRNHKWYMEARLVTVNDLYAFDPNLTVTLDPFLDIIGRHFRQPKEGLGHDNSPVAHMWRTIADPDAPL